MSLTPRRVGLFVVGWVVAGLLLALWQLAAAHATLIYLPTFTASLRALWSIVTGSSLHTDVLPSIVRAIVGYAVGCAVGIAVGLPLGYFRWLEPWARPVLEFLRSLPPPAILPLALLLLGTTSTMKIAMIAFGCCWPVLLNATDGARNVDPLLIETGKIANHGTLSILDRIVLPAALPQVFAGLRTAVGIALIMMVISEMIAASAGLGYLILHAQRTFSVDEMYGGVLLLGVIGWLFTAAFSLVERRVLSWHRGATGGGRG